MYARVCVYFMIFITIALKAISTHEFPVKIHIIMINVIKSSRSRITVMNGAVISLVTFANWTYLFLFTPSIIHLYLHSTSTINLFDPPRKCQKSIINPFITVKNNNYFNKQAPYNIYGTSL